MTTLMFGRYSGVRLDEIPHPYPRWVVKNVDLDYKYPGLKQQIKAIIRNCTGPPRNSPAGSWVPSAPTSSAGTSPRPDKVSSDAVLVKVAGTSYHQGPVKASLVGDPVRLAPDPTNAFDPYALRLINTRLETRTGDGWLGFIPRKYSQMLSAAINNGHTFNAVIASLPNKWGPGGTSIVSATISIEVDTGQ